MRLLVTERQLRTHSLVKMLTENNCLCIQSINKIPNMEKENCSGSRSKRFRVKCVFVYTLNKYPSQSERLAVGQFPAGHTDKGTFTSN